MPIDQRRLAGARHAGHRAHHAERNAARRRRAGCSRSAPLTSIQPLGRRRVAGTSMRRAPTRSAPSVTWDRARSSRRRARRHHLAAVPSRARAEVDHPVGRLDGLRVVLDDQHASCRDRAAAAASRSAAGCRAGAARLTARRARTSRPTAPSRAATPAGCAAPRRPTASSARAIERQIVEPDVHQEAEPALISFEHLDGDLLLARPPASCARKCCCASATVRRVASQIDLSARKTARDSGRRRSPPQSPHGLALELPAFAVLVLPAELDLAEAVAPRAHAERRVERQHLRRELGQADAALGAAARLRVARGRSSPSTSTRSCPLRRAQRRLDRVGQPRALRRAERRGGRSRARWCASSASRAPARPRAAPPCRRCARARSRPCAPRRRSSRNSPLRCSTLGASKRDLGALAAASRSSSTISAAERAATAPPHKWQRCSPARA